MTNIVKGHSKFRDVISQDSSELVVHISDILSKPQREVFSKYNPYSYTKCARALPIARSEDLVVLTGKLDKEYYSWLRDLGFGPDHVHAYGYEGVEKILSDLIQSDPEPIKKIIKKTGRHPVLVPFFTSAQEKVCAKLLDGEVFGPEEGVCSKYFNKATFKQECRNLGIEVIGGVDHEVDSNNILDYEKLEQHVLGLLSGYRKVIIRGELGSAGSSIYETQSSNIAEVYRKLQENQDKRVLIEPMLDVIASPNDQWAIDRKGQIHHLGISAQLFQGLKHAGNLKGQYFSERTYSQMTQTSLKMVKRMFEDGYQGVLGIDYIITEDAIYPTENNARINGSTFTYAIVDRVEEQIGKVPCWKFFKGMTEPCSYSTLIKQLGSLMYDGTSINRIFPYDCDTLSINGTFAVVLMAEDMYHIDFLEQALKYLDIVSI